MINIELNKYFGNELIKELDFNLDDTLYCNLFLDLRIESLRELEIELNHNIVLDDELEPNNVLGND